MVAKKAPAAPPSPVSTGDIQGAWSGATSGAQAVGNNQYPQQVWNTFAPGMMSTTPYGFNPNQAVQAGQNWANQAPQMFAGANQIMQTGFDPQNDLYNRTSQQVQDAARASQGARGIGNTPYGASLENQSMRDFNIDWQNQQLGRQVQAAGGASNLWNAGGNAVQGGTNIQSMIPAIMAQYAAGIQNIGQNATAPQAQASQLFGNLFGQGTSAQQNAYQQQLEQFKQNQASQAGLWGGIGNMVGSVFGMPTQSGSAFLPAIMGF